MCACISDPLFPPMSFVLQDKVLSQLQAQQKFIFEAEAERKDMLQKIIQLEELVRMYSRFLKTDQSIDYMVILLTELHTYVCA